MPYIWVDPEEFLKLPGGVSVCYCYKRGSYLFYHYQFRNNESDTGWSAFDIRDLAHAVRQQHPDLEISDANGRRRHQALMIRAANLGGEGGLLAFIKENHVDLRDSESL